MSEPDRELWLPPQKWRQIEQAWIRYCHGGASAFDWDYDSRDVMRALTGHGAFGNCEQAVHDQEAVAHDDERTEDADHDISGSRGGHGRGHGAGTDPRAGAGDRRGLATDPLGRLAAPATPRGAASQRAAVEAAAQPCADGGSPGVTRCPPEPHWCQSPENPNGYSLHVPTGPFRHDPYAALRSHVHCWHANQSHPDPSCCLCDGCIPAPGLCYVPSPAGVPCWYAPHNGDHASG